MAQETSTAPYERRRAAGLASREETRARLLRAADELFLEQGYSATTVSAIAERAGTSLQTLYLAWGSKSALFRAAADAAAAASGMPMTPQAWREAITDRLDRDAGPDPSTETYLAAIVHVFVEVAERTTSYWRMQPGAAATDPDIAAGFATTMAQRRITMEEIARTIPHQHLRPGLTETEIVDTIWSLASPETFWLFTGQLNRSTQEFSHWLTTTLTNALCAD